MVTFKSHTAAVARDVRVTKLHISKKKKQLWRAQLRDARISSITLWWELLLRHT